MGELNYGIGEDLKVGFIGFGVMGQNLCRGFIQGVLKAENAIAFDVNKQGLTKALDSFGGVKQASSNREVVNFADVIIIAVKPNFVELVLRDVKAIVVTDRHVFLSIAAGITIEQLEDALPPKTHVIRCMPNAAVSVMQGATVVSRGSSATERDEELAVQIMGSVGLCMSLPEKDLNCVTAISGSGPAYVFMALDAVGDGGSMMGLPRDVAQRLAAQTMIGAAKMFLESGHHPGALKDFVTSAGGTTLSGINHLEKGSFRGLIMGTVKAGHDRAVELAKENH